MSIRTLHLSLFILALLFAVTPISAQNFVPNGGFEEIDTCPKEFGDFAVKGWYPLGADNTPDLYSGCNPPNAYFSPNNAWVVRPVEGKSYAGIVLFHADEPNQAFHEVIYVKLSIPLTAGHVYRLRFSLAAPTASRWVCTTINAILTKNKPVMVSDVSTLQGSTNLLFDLDPLYPGPGWQVFENEFEAKGGEQYLCIGNFRKTQETKATMLSGRTDPLYKTTFNIAYACLDDVQVIPVDADTPPMAKKTVPKTATPANAGAKVAPPKAAAVKPEVKQEVKKETPKPVVAKADTIKKELPKPVVVQDPPKPFTDKEELILNDLNFNTDSWQLKNKTVPELDPLINYLKANKNKHVIVTGYTDNKGGTQHNDVLSKRRADTITAYLVSHGIERDRISSRGFGSEMPIATNDTETGRKQNRRVELRVQ